MSLDLTARTFWIPKEGNSEEEFEDAFHPPSLRDRKGRILRFAVADGASEGMLSGPWAKILVRAFCRASQRPTASSARQVIARACDSWETWLAAYLQRRNESGRPVQWWEEQGLSNGPFSTLVGVAFLLREGSGAGRWDAVAMGDSCLFGVSGSLLKVRFPIESSSGFGSRPVLISSDPRRNAAYLDRIVQTGGTFEPGDRFYLMTDALSAWFLREVEAGEEPWERLDEAVGDGDGATEGDDSGFRDLVHCLRASGKMRNDDVTLTCIRVVSS
jgi:hypothetical protein